MLRGRGISTGSSCSVVHSVCFALTMSASLSSVGRAMAPAVTARDSGDSAARPSSEQNSRVKAAEISLQAVAPAKIPRYGDSARFPR